MIHRNTNTTTSSNCIASADFEQGDRVVDRDDESDGRDPAVVIELPTDPAYAYEIEAINASVADVNPDYPASAPVATVAFVSALDKITNWRVAAAGALPAVCEEWGVQTYAYPVPRLAREEGDRE